MQDIGIFPSTQHDWRSSWYPEALGTPDTFGFYAGEPTPPTKPYTPKPKTLNKYQIGLTTEDVTSLCSAAQRAWDAAPPRTRSVTFTWRGRRYKSRLTTFRMLVEAMDGSPVACRWG
jgi:hypothetical protein